MARNQYAKKKVDDANNLVAFTFSDGRVLTAGMDEFNISIIRRLALHGLSQKIGDSYAGDESVREAFDSANETLNDLLKGEWSTRTPGEPKIGLLIDGLFRVRQVKDPAITIERVRAVVEAMDAEKKKALRANPQIKSAMADIQAERLRAEAEKSIEDTDALFA